MTSTTTPSTTYSVENTSTCDSLLSADSDVEENASKWHSSLRVKEEIINVKYTCAAEKAIEDRPKRKTTGHSSLRVKEEIIEVKHTCAAEKAMEDRPKRKRAGNSATESSQDCDKTSDKIAKRSQTAIYGRQLRCTFCVEFFGNRVKRHMMMCKKGPSNLNKEQKEELITKILAEQRELIDNFVYNAFVPESLFDRKTFTGQEVRNLFVKYGHCIVPSTFNIHFQPKPQPFQASFFTDGR